MAPGVLTAPYVLEYSYKRSVGPVVGRFLAGLRDRQVWGLRARDRRVIVPPPECDPLTGEPLTDWVRVEPTGVVETWCWVPEPRPGNPLQRPFAWALVRLDGAHTGLLHALDAGEVSRVHSGLRVRIRWAEEPQGHILDIAAFEPVEAA